MQSNSPCTSISLCLYRPWIWQYPVLAYNWFFCIVYFILVARILLFITFQWDCSQHENLNCQACDESLLWSFLWPWSVGWCIIVDNRTVFRRSFLTSYICNLNGNIKKSCCKNMKNKYSVLLKLLKWILTSI